MQYLLLIYSDEKANAAHMDKLGEADRKAELGKWFAYTEELKKADVFVAGEALQPTATATTVRARNDDPITTDGPFAETKELIAGYAIYDLPSMQEAVTWACRFGDLGGVEEMDIRLMED